MLIRDYLGVSSGPWRLSGCNNDGAEFILSSAAISDSSKQSQIAKSHTHRSHLVNPCTDKAVKSKTGPIWCVYTIGHGLSS
jgi:hypothetical protein